MKYLNSKRETLFKGGKVAYRGKVYWANTVTMEIYAHSIEAEIYGMVNGYKVANIDENWNIVKCK